MFANLSLEPQLIGPWLFQIISLEGYIYWYSHVKTSFEGSTIESITSQFRLHQLINQPTHLLQNSPLCVDLIFTSQPNIVVELGVHPSLHRNCHHQIAFAKFNLRIYYPTPYLREFSTINKQTLILSNKQLTISTGKKLFLTLILMRKFLFSTRRS